MAHPKFLLLFCLLFLNCKLIAQGELRLDIEALTQIVNQYTDDELPGLAIGVVAGGKIVFEHYQGIANLEHQIAIGPSTRFNIASTAKQFTALMILQLSKEDKLSLEDDIRKFIPTLYATQVTPVKVRHLINHSSGIRDYVFLLEMMNKPFWKQVGMDNDDVIALLEQQQTLTFTPGSRYAYSNSGYTILTKIIEHVTGESFIDYSTRFFTELGMQETAFSSRYMGVIPNRADAYSDWGDGVWLATPTVTKFRGDGFLYTSLKDQLIFEQAIQLAEATNNALLLEGQQPIPNSEIETYGFGLELDTRLGRKARYHSGSTFGYHAHTNRFPEEKLSVFVMSNNGKIWSGDIADEIAAAILPEVDKQEAYDDQINDPQFDLGDPQVIGQYLSPTGMLIRVEEEGGKLLWKKANWISYEIVREGQNSFTTDYNSEIKIRFGEKGLFRFYPSGETIFYARSTTGPASLADIEGFVGHYRSEELDMSFEIKMTDDQQLKIKFSNRKKERDVSILNRNQLLASNFQLEIKRDQFDRAIDVLVTLNERAKRNPFRKASNLKFQPKISTEDGYIQVTTVGSVNGDASDILLTKNFPNGNEIWSRQFGGKSYDKASSILATKDGYLIIGSTSSYGNGNYDVFVIKTDKSGKKQWQNTFGGSFNEYGYVAEKTESGFLLKGSIQSCTPEVDILQADCTTNVWHVFIDEKGKEIARKVLDEL